MVNWFSACSTVLVRAPLRLSLLSVVSWGSCGERLVRARAMVHASVQFEAGEIFQNRWVIVHQLAAGGFGSVYTADDTRTGIRCAVKVESLAVGKSVMQMELAVLRELNKATNHACELLGNGVIQGRAKFVAMSLLGKNLYDLKRLRPNGRFERRTVSRLAIQCVEAVQALHQIGYLHRDIKPANFAVGLTPHTYRTVHLIDFGLARLYRSPGPGHTVKPPRALVGFRGTVRYASIAAHLGQEQGRRDDVCSLLYSLVEFWKGQLPWRGVNDDRYVSRMKMETGMEDLMLGMEWQYIHIGNAVLNLRYADQPDYERYLQLLREMQRDHAYPNDGPFEWE